MSMSKEAAEKEVERLNEIDPDWFCPLLLTLCNPACVCFVKAFLREVVVWDTTVVPVRSSKAWDVVKPQCNNAMFFNQCSCQ